MSIYSAKKELRSFEEKKKIFYEKHGEFRREEGRDPEINEFASYSDLSYQTLLGVLKQLEAGGNMSQRVTLAFLIASSSSFASLFFSK